MLFNPRLSSLGSTEVLSVAARPPEKLYIPTGGISCAWRSTEVPFAGKRSRHSGAQKAGLAYQKRIGKWLGSIDPRWRVDPSPWFAYCDGGGKRRYCQPDFLLLDESNSTICIVEVKITWTSSAWWQLRKLYEPVLRAVYPNHTFIPIVISRSYDPILPREEEPNLCADLMDAKPDRFNVVIVR